MSYKEIKLGNTTYEVSSFFSGKRSIADILMERIDHAVENSAFDEERSDAV